MEIQPRWYLKASQGVLSGLNMSWTAPPQCPKAPSPADEKEGNSVADRAAPHWRCQVLIRVGIVLLIGVDVRRRRHIEKQSQRVVECVMDHSRRSVWEPGRQLVETERMAFLLLLIELCHLVVIPVEGNLAGGGVALPDVVQEQGGMDVVRVDCEE